MLSVYPTQIAEILPSIKTVVSMVRNGSAISAVNDFAFNVWVIQGYIQGITFGLPSGQTVLSGSINADTANREELVQLGEALMLYESMQVYGAHDNKRLNPIQIMTAIKFIFDMLKSLGIFDKDEAIKKMQAAQPKKLDQDSTETLVETGDNYDSLAKKADDGDEVAATELQSIADSVGITTANCKDWEDCVTQIRAKQSQTT